MHIRWQQNQTTIKALDPSSPPVDGQHVSAPQQTWVGADVAYQVYVWVARAQLHSFGKTPDHGKRFGSDTCLKSEYDERHPIVLQQQHGYVHAVQRCRQSVSGCLPTLPASDTYHRWIITKVAAGNTASETT